MPLGPFGEILGTTGTLESLGPNTQKYKSKVTAPRNPKLVKQNVPDKYKMTPSKFLFDMSLTTEQKLANTHVMNIPLKTELLDMGDTSLQQFSKVNIDEPLFQPFPSEVYFQNFNPFEVYEVPLIFRNNDKVPRLIKISQENSPYFKIINPHDIGHKVGPGLPTTFKIQFKPDEKKDYKHELVCITEREKFVVPIRAIGARGILDFPDNIHFPSSYVKYSNTKTLLVRNIGNKEAKFSLKAKPPFSVTPDIGSLGVNEGLQVTVEFKPLQAMDYTGTLLLSYNTGEEVIIDLYGSAQDANIRLDKNSIRIENTYISMANQRTIVITNHSDLIAHFRWTQFATSDDEDQHKLLHQIELDREENSDTDRFLEECICDPMLRDKLSILSRTFQNRKKAVENDPLLFQDDIISIEPTEGDIWPNSNFEIIVVFKPREATSYTRTAYCDITGREDRLPLRIRGEGMGPKVDFSFDYLEMGNIFIGSKHTYEIVIANKGDIDAIYSVVHNNSIFSPCFAFNPAEGIVMPGGHQAIEVAFSSPYLGDFEETFCVQVDGQPRQCPIKFSGRVVGPTFHFDVPKLKFGTVAFGFLSSQVCHLINTSLVPMVFHLRVPSDGVNKSVFCIEDIETSPMDVGPSPASDPKEFEIIPSHGVIMAQSQIQVTVNLVPNTVRKYQVAIVVDVERVGEELISLPISARSQVPEISIPKQILNYGRCFIHYPYELCISLYNETDLDAKYEIFPQAENNFESSPISYRSPKPKGIITAHSTVDVPLVITANVLQDQEITCLVRIFGRSDPIPLTVMCVGEGPVVHLNQYSIDWGETQVLVDSERTLVMTNESFIPARFKANMLRPNTVFRVSPTEGEIPPEQTIELKVTVNLDDCVRFQDKLNISITDSQARQVPLQAFGKGTTIISDPQLGPILNLGPNFSNKILQKKFKLTNRGRRIQQLVWMTEGCMHSARVKREKGSRTNQINGKSKSSSTALDVNHPVFQLLPNRMELHPGESIDFTLEGYVDGPQIVSETIICHAIIGRVGGKIPIISVNIRAEFIEPLLNFSTKCAFFRIDKEMGQELIPQRKQLTMNNVSSLPLTVGLKLAYPFSMIIDDQRICDTTVCLQTGDVYDLVIEFDPMFKDDSYIRTIDEVLYVTYKEHPHVDYIALRGEVYFPNLEFEKKAVDFGCILNDTEVTRYINITNISPMSVHYHWSFLVGDVPTSVKKKTRFKIPELTDVDEKVNADADVSTDVDEKVNADADMSTENTKETMIRRTGTGNDERENQVTIEEPYLTQNADVDNEKKEESAVDDNRRNRDLNIDVDIPEKGQLDQEEKLNDEKEKNFVEEERRSRVISRMSLLENEEESLRCNKVLTALLEDSDDTVAIGVEEVFDILPLYGCLQPDETEQVTFTFYGHADILGEVQAICKVEDGPTYEIKLTGEASVVEYAFSNKTIDLGKELYDSLATSTLTLFNTGKVGFEFTAVNMDPALETQPIPGQLVMVPHSGFIKAFGEQKIEVRLIPGIPESFQKTFQIQVAHFKPDTITVSGEGVFPRVSLNLPRLGDDAGVYASLMKEARENLGRLIKEEHQKAVISLQEVSVEELEKVTSVAEVGLSIEEVMKGGPVQESENVSSAVKITDQSTKEKKESAEMSESLHEKPVDLEANKGDQPDKPSVVKSLSAPVIEVIEPSELELQMEMERLTVRNFVLKHQEDSGPLSTTNSKGENALLPVSSDSTVFSSEPLSSSKIKPVLPGYLLDFGYVVLGTVRTHVVHATNTGWVPVSFKIDQHEMHAAGFRTELDRVRNLPGSPDNETLDFVITFDPRGANLPLGPVEVLAPINIVKGPMLTLCLRAYVTMPDMKISADVLEFGKVKCGECKVITVQLHNHQMVKCDWDSSILEDKKKIEKHVPMHLRRKKRREKKQPNNFEVLPPTGTLLSGQRINVQVKFMPTEEKLYEHRIPIRIAQSSQRINLLCYGQGLEPRLDFERALIEFTPILPHSSGDEQTVVIGNPCPFPIEFYSLEFDPTYLFEERVLRLMRGYDEYNTLLLPPRGVGEKLPQELLQYYDELFKKVKEEEQAKAEAQAEAERKEREEKEKEELAAAQLLASEKVEEPKKEEEKPKEKEKKEKKSHKKAIPSETTGETALATELPQITVEQVTETVMTKEEPEDNKAVQLPEETDNVEAALSGTALLDENKDAEGGIENLEDGIMKAQTESLMTSSSSVTQCLSFTEIPSKTSLPPSVSADDEIIKIENLMEEKMKASLASGPGVGELEITPVSAAIARCLGIDLTSEGKAAKNRRGIAIVIHGAPKSGKTSTAIALAKHYQAALLTIDGVVCDAIANGNTQAGLKARELCSLAARKLSEDQSNQETVDGEKKLTNFSVEAVAAHTQAGTTAGSASGSRKISIRQTAAVSGKSTFLASSAEGATASLIPSSPPPSAFPPQHLSISASIAGENGFISCILPEDLLVEILGDRLQLNDCYRGVVFDGLETLFSPSYLSTTLAVLKALNNRRFIYFCTLKLEYSALKEQEEKACRQKELEEREKEEKELMWLEEMDEDEYDALSEDEKNRVDNKRLALKKEKIKRDKEKAQKDKQERAAREELERKKEEERLKGRGRKHRASVDEKRDKDKRAQAGGKNQDQARKPEKIQERSESASSDHHGERRREKNRSKTANDHGGEEVKDSSDQLLMQRFQYFEAAQKDIQDLLEHWDRSTLQPCRPLTPSEKSEEEPKELPMSVKRGKVKDKIEKQKEQERLHHEKELAEKAAKGISEDARTVYSEHTEEEKKEEIGVPHIIVDCANKTFSVPAVTKNDFLPSTSESRTATELKSGSKNKSANRSSTRRTRNSNFSSSSNPNVVSQNKLISRVEEVLIPSRNEDEEVRNPYADMTIAEMLLVSEKLSSFEAVLDGLGLGPQGPPIPPPATFAVVPYPAKRRAPHISSIGASYVFVASSPDDPNIGLEQKEVEADMKDEEKSRGAKTPDTKTGRTSSESRVESKRSAERRKLLRHGSSMSPASEEAQTPAPEPESINTAGSLSQSDEKVPAKVLTHFRWMVPACGSITLKLKFTATEMGQFDQTLNFELVGTRRRYQIFCRGVCSFPTISKEPRLVFLNRKRSRKENEIVHKKYILATETFEFGPLLVGKSRESYREGKYPENMEDFTIVNTSPIEADVSFCFLSDSRAETFMLEPTSMILKPKESGKLTVWAYPRGPGHYEDAVVCCVRENPEPVLFKISCDGFRPELDLDKKVIQFDKVLLHRKDTKSIYLRNTTHLPVAWKLSGLDNLGDDVTVAAESGIVEPLSEYPLQAFFRAMKATPSSKKTIRIEISDADYILGVVHAESIQIIVEAYDVALDMSFPKVSAVLANVPRKCPVVESEKPASHEDKKISAESNRVLSTLAGQQGKPLSGKDSSVEEKFPFFYGPNSSKTEFVDVQSGGDQRHGKKGAKPPTPVEEKKARPRRFSGEHVPLPTFSLAGSKGTDGGLDFGTVKVSEEVKQICALKNKGKYEIAFEFLLESVSPKKTEFAELFTVSPSSGKLNPSDRPTQVQVIFRSSREVSIKDLPILKCQVIEPSLGEQGETIASIPVKVSVKAVFSKFSITPSYDLNFGTLVVGSRKTRTFTIENNGEFDFKYLIFKSSSPSPDGIKSNRDDKKSFLEATLGAGAKPKKESMKVDARNMDSKLTLGMFTIYPVFGIILPKGNQVITVDCVAENTGKDLQDIHIEINDRDPSTNKGGVPYQLMAEACIPSIDINDIGSIFEEHRVCKNLSVWQHVNRGQSEIGGIYGEEEKKFVFNNVIVGRQAKARFRITNPNKVPCDVVLALKPIPQRGAPKSQDVFDLDPPRMQIANNSHMYATVTFTPTAMQSYSTMFEASVESMAANQPRGKSLIFEVSGEGNLPGITVTKPTLRNRRGQPLLLFKRLLIGRSESLPMELINESTLPSKVDIDLVDPDNCFLLKPTKETKSVIGDIDYDDAAQARKRPHTASLIVNIGENATFEVIYRPSAPQRSQANLKITVVDNEYEDSIIQMIGEGFQDDITLDNIGSAFISSDLEDEIAVLPDDDVPAICGGTSKQYEYGEEEDPYDDSDDEDDDEEEEGEEKVKNKVVAVIRERKSAEQKRPLQSDNIIGAAKPNLMRFGDCYVNESRTLSLTMTNHSKTDCIRFQWPDHPQFKFSPQVGHLHASCTKDIAVTFTSNVSVTYFECPMDCRVTKIIFDKPIDQVCDWDDKIQIVKWVDDLPPAPPSLRSGSKSSLLPVTASHPAKKKVTETEPEPSFREVANSTRTVELLISSVADFVRCSCEVTSIQFKDTLMFQTRVYSITVQNEGRVALDYSWHVVMDNLVSTVKQPVTYTSSTERPESRVDLVDVTYVPFMVDPAYGSIPAGKTAQCLVKFAPLDANDYQGKLICSIPHMDSDEVGPFIELRGRSLVPYCHFELEDSDYISSARRNPELRGPGGAPPGSILDPNTRVIEFNICGTGVKSYKEFGIVNPTSSDYSFQWVCDDAPDTKEPSRFHCVNRQGQIKSGSKFKVGFEFTSRELGIVESFWRFTIPDQPISLPFLLVGNTKEPDVCLDRSHLNFKSVLVGRGARETVFLTNNENTWFNFAFDEVTCHTEAYASHLIVEPLQGQISAKSSVPINIYFSPNFEKEVNFNLRCVVARKVTPLTLNVKAEGISMNCVLFLEDISGAKTQLSEKGVNQVDFGEVEVTELVMKNLLIVNCGKFTFDFTWDLIHTQTGTSMVNITPQSGSIKHGESHQCTLSYCPHKHKALKGCELQLKITNGPTYQLCLTGVGVIPSLHFSFLSHSFGSCFIHKTGAGLPTKKVVLQLRNKDKKQIGVDCLFEATNYLMYKFQSCVLAPGEKVNIPFTFCPRQAMKYHETVTFLINGVSRQNVEFFGSGSELKIEVIDPNQKCVNFGARMVGDSLRKFVPIVNRSPVPVTFNLAFTPNEPALQSFDALGVSPKEAITLSASGGTTKVEVLFRPKARIPQFTEEVLVECAGTFQPLFVVKGSCLGMEVSLDSDSISFGTVFQRSSSSRKLVMSNNGDMNTKFRWDIKHFKPDFSISPVEGYITPGMEVSFQIDFHPQNICADVRYEKLKCFLDGGPQKPITLTLTGSCTGIPPVKEVQHFQAVVRQSETKQIMIPNKSNQPWNLKPIIDGEYWTGPLTFTVEPQQTKAYELTYKPMTMTAEGKKHLGSIFFPLPDGSGLLFNLSGTADAPRAAGKIQREVPCKTSYTEVLTVTNWQKKLQRFHVKIESLRDKVDPGTTVKGAEYIDLPAKSKKDYKLSFFAYKEGQTFVKVTFTNEQSGEYQFYEVLFRATRPGTVATINLSTPVRQSVPYVITVENPLSYQVNFQITCSVAEVLIPNQLAVPPQSQGQFSFEFQPLKTGIVNGHLELNSTDLGLYLYELVLTATPGAPEKAIYFRTYLGSSVSQVAKFLNFAKVKTDYACKIASQDFHVEKMVAAAPASTGGTEVAIDVLFEPSALGEQHAKLLVASPVGGDYIIPLFGTCLSPKPQGPFSIKAGSSISIIFKNVFNTTTYFTFQVDNPLFHVAKQSESIRSNKEYRIVVSFDGADSHSKAAVMGKLIVSCLYSAGGTSNVQWMYYLKGV